MGDVIFIHGKGGNGMVDIKLVARYFLSLESMSHLKLQKICYYAQAWHLALFGTPLMDTWFEAWVHGPVSPILYQEYKKWGWYNITQYEQTLEGIDEKVRKFLNTIYSLYGAFDGNQLEELTHKEEPWNLARKGCKPGEHCETLINPEDMQRYYRNLLKE